MPAAFLASLSSSTSMLITLTPAFSALAIGVTIAFEFGRRDDDDVVFLGDEVLDRVDLRGEVALVLHADRLEVELVGVGGGVFLRARLHLLEELVGERLHHQADLRLVGGEGRRQAAGKDRDRPGRAGDDEMRRVRRPPTTTGVEVSRNLVILLLPSRLIGAA